MAFHHVLKARRQIKEEPILVFERRRSELLGAPCGTRYSAPRIAARLPIVRATVSETIRPHDAPEALIDCQRVLSLVMQSGPMFAIPPTATSTVATRLRPSAEREKADFR